MTVEFPTPFAMVSELCERLIEDRKDLLSENEGLQNQILRLKSRLWFALHPKEAADG